MLKPRSKKDFSIPRSKYNKSKSIHFNYLEKLPFEKILGLNFEELKKIVIVDNKFKKFIINKNKILKKDKVNPLEKEYLDESKKDLNFEDIILILLKLV